MNIVFIIGNGFDINLGMNTRYSDFYAYYKKQETTSKLIKDLKASINSEIDTWADLELALGAYTSNIKTVDDFDEIFIDIQTNLSKYLQQQEENFDVSKVDLKKLFNNLGNPENYLVNREKQEIKFLKKQWTNHQWGVEIITLNYTRVLEKMLDNKGFNLEIGKHNNSNIILRNISHIHGYTNERMILGVNDSSQISNEVLKKDIDVTETLIKEKCNQAQGHMVEEDCKAKINKANLICIFGSSLGKTDKIWWDLITERLSENCHLIIFDRDKTVSPLRLQYQKRIERDKLKEFLDGRKIKPDVNQMIKSKIHFGINTEMFKLK